MIRLLAALALASTAASEPRLIWSDASVTLLGAPSRDGRFLSYVEPGTGALSLYEIATGRKRILAAGPQGSKEFAYFSAISPDSKQVAYAWFNDQGYYDLRVVSIEGGEPRVLYRNEEAGFVQPCAWTPDGERILTLFFRKDNISQISLVPAAGGAPKTLRSLNWVYPKRMDLSPDGRFIVYDSFARGGAGDRTIYLLAVDGSKELKLVDRPGNHLFPLWTPDGGAIIYLSDTAGSMDAWTLEVRDGKAGESRVLRRDLGRALPLGVTGDGQYMYGARNGASDVFVTTLDNPAASAKRASLRFPNRNGAPAWSPDGTRLAYLSRRGSENFGEQSRAIVIRELDSDTEREIPAKLAHLERIKWSPDGKLLVSGSDAKGRSGLYLVDPDSGSMKALVEQAGGAYRGIEGALGKDGAVYYIHEGRELRVRDTAERVLAAGRNLRSLAMSPEGKRVACLDGDDAVVIAGEEIARLRFAGATELEWGAHLVAGKGSELWRVPLDGSAPVQIAAPGNRERGFSLHPDGKRIAVTAGSQRSEIRALKLQ